MTPEERAQFLEAVADAVPLDGAARDRVRVPPPPPTPRAEPALPPRVALHLEGDGDVILARAPGVNRAQLAELRAGRVHAEATLDLHGQTAAAAAAQLRRFLVEAAAHRRRCVLVVHGRGLHSDDGRAILRDVVHAELAGALSGLVRAFATAAPRHGGPGATFVLVKP